MRLLLDTHLLLWMVGDRSALSSKARVMLEDSQNDLLFSPVSLFEVAVKALKKRDDFVVNVRELRQELLLQSVAELPLFSDHTLEIALLPPIHHDPFDRLLLAQAIHEQVALLTVDAKLLQYPSNVMDAR